MLHRNQNKEQICVIAVLVCFFCVITIANRGAVRKGKKKYVREYKQQMYCQDNKTLVFTLNPI